jgi:hypothetical protein
MEELWCTQFQARTGTQASPTLLPSDVDIQPLRRMSAYVSAHEELGRTRPMGGGLILGPAHRNAFTGVPQVVTMAAGLSGLEWRWVASPCSPTQCC